jgi:phage shock protein A
MGFLKRLWGYLVALFKGTAEKAMNPEIEIEQAISQARSQDQKLRNQAAQVIAHRTQLEAKIESAADDVGEAREMAKQALLKADEAQKSGDTEAVGKWTRAAQSLAMKLQAAENNLSGFKEQYTAAASQAEDAKKAVEQNAMRLQELAAKKMELVGKLQQAKMQEAVNKTVESISASMETEAPSLDKVEDKINVRLANAQAKAELHEATPEGAESELREAISVTQADAKLEELRKELGLEA